MQCILVATDGSSGADRAVDVAARLAKAMDAKLLIVTIGGNLSADGTRQLSRAEGNIGDALESLSSQILAAAKDRARQHGISDIDIQAGWGDAAEQIIELAKRSNADVIVLGRRGRGRLTGLLLGSVSQKVVTLAPCIVAVVP
jgi:nucleotide-binding universal stress UspA family protein